MPTVLPFAGLRFAAPANELERLVCPPYDVISPEEQAQLLQASPHNAVRLELPLDEPGQPGSRYPSAAEQLRAWRAQGVLGPTRGRPTTSQRRVHPRRGRAAAARPAGRCRRRALVGACRAAPRAHHGRSESGPPRAAARRRTSTPARSGCCTREPTGRARPGLGGRRDAPARRRVHAGAESSIACG